MSKTATEYLTGTPLTIYSEDENMFRASVREFAEGEIRPRVEEMDEHGKFDPALLKHLFDLGLMCIETPEEYGGAGASFFTAIIGVEELSRVDPSVGVLMDVQNTLVNNALIRWGSPEQKKKYLPQLAADKLGAYCLSEAGSGSDAFAMATRAVEVGDHFRLTGQKLWITNGNEAEIFIVFAKPPRDGYRGVTACIFEKVSGFSVAIKRTNRIRALETETSSKLPCSEEHVLGEVVKLQGLDRDLIRADGSARMIVWRAGPSMPRSVIRRSASSSASRSINSRASSSSWPNSPRNWRPRV